MKHVNLNEQWHVKERDPERDPLSEGASAEGWIPATVPGTVHQALLAAGRLPDPFYGLNEHEVQWVGEREWLYRCEFTVDSAFLESGPATLCCEGLDTVATVWLNGTQVLYSDNMFVPARAAVSSLLSAGTNVLVILFQSALRYGQAQEAQLGKLRAWNGDASRVYVRKAQYHYGWDWGPCLMTAGPWRAISLEAGAARIVDVACPVDVEADLERAVLPVQVTIETPAPAAAQRVVRLRLIDPDGATIDQAEVQGEAPRHTFVVLHPRLWWPNGYGAQPLYRLQVALLEDGTERDRQEVRIGLRRLRLVQEPIEGEPGTTFLFALNNTPIFCGGANWIPADSFTTRLTAQDYRLQLQQAAAAHMVMLRIWGGGIYEDDVFYDLCDELGLMVWQDFMFACGIYPAHQAFQRSVQAEAEAQVHRLRHHPSLVLWCGNNEDYQIAESIKAYDADIHDDFTATRFPARAIYEQLLPEVCGRLDPVTPYWPGSPYGGKSVADQTVGDRHTWDIWHGATAPYSQYPRYEGRFVSEFGMEACPAPETLAAVVPLEERYPQSRTVEHHNKSTDGPRRLAIYLNDTLRTGTSLEDYIYATQFVQAEAMVAAYRGWRRRWQGPGKYAVAGALVWQLDDCWPVISWAIVDYARRPKPAYYALRRELAPLAVGLAPAEGGTALWAVNGTTQEVQGVVQLTGYLLDGTQVVNRELEVVLAANGTSELGNQESARQEPLVMAACLLVNGDVVARATLWPEPFKYLALPDPRISMERGAGDRLLLRSECPAKGVWLAAGDGVDWSDNMLDLLPGETREIHAPGLGDREVRVQYLRLPS